MLPLLLISTALALTPEDAQAILQIEALRLPPLALSSFVESPDAETRARAARALGRLRTRAAMAGIMALARDPEPSVRAEAAFALGQTADTGDALNAWLRTEGDPAVRAAIVEGLGKQGDAAVIPTLLLSLRARSATLAPALEAEAAAVALGRLAMRGVADAKSAQVTEALLDSLGRFDRDLRRGAAFSLGRIGAPALPAEQVELLLERAQEDRDPVVRAFLVRATGPLELPAARRDALYAACAADPDTGVRVAVARAAGASGWAGVTRLLKDREVGVRLEAIGALAKVKGVDHRELLEPLLAAGSTLDAAEAARTKGSPDELLGAAALGTLATLDLLPAAGPLSLGDLLAPERPTLIRATAAGLLPDRDQLVALAVKDGEASVRTAAVSHLLELGPRMDQILALFDAFDALVVAVAAEHLSEHPLPEAERRILDGIATANPDQLDLLIMSCKALAPLYEGARPLVRSPAPEAASLIGALLTHSDAHVREEAARVARALSLPLPPYQHTLPMVDLAAVAKVRTARILTTRGEVIVTLDSENAPITVWNWASLAQRGWFDGLRFHRVVPDFVVQDGDPRGDGWGGPGYTIPDEIAPGHYREGTLGMALSGPDTGGSQWFVTLSPQPHLDGGYTIFGEVSSGMQVFRSIQAGDRIISITIER